MCGIVGYVGDNSASPILIDGLKKLEYRGYDSAGIAVCRNGKITTVKTKGRISDLQQKLDEVGTPQGSVGIGHTRWATHGAPTDANAHPHSGSSGRVTLVHNGIIENYLELKAELEKQGRQFKSQTDTEVLAQLFDSLYDGNPLETMLKVIKRVRGSYAVAVLMSDHPDEILAALSKQLPEGIEAISVYASERKIKELKWLKITGIFEYDERNAGNMAVKLNEFYAKDIIVISKKTKRGIGASDIKQAIKEIAFTDDGDNVRLDAIVSAQGPTLNPELLAEALRQLNPEIAPDYAKFRRLEVYDENMRIFR